MSMSVQEYDTILYCDLILKIEGFADKMQSEEELIRNVAYSAYIAPHIDRRKMAKNIEAFWSIKKKGDTKKVSDAKREAIRLELKRINLEKHGTS